MAVRSLDTMGVIGAGAWGIALANAASRAGRNVVLYGRDTAQMETLRDQWIAEPDAGKQKEIAASLERRAFEFVPYVPAGLVQQPMAYRKSLTGMVLSPVQFFWNMEKKV